MAAELEKELSNIRNLQPKADQFGSLPSVLNGLQEALRTLPELTDKAARHMRECWFTGTPKTRQAIVGVVEAFENFTEAIQESLRQNKPYLNPTLLKVYEKDLKRFSSAVSRFRKVVNDKKAIEHERSLMLNTSQQDLSDYKQALRELEDNSSAEIFTAEEFQQRFR